MMGTIPKSLAAAAGMMLLMTAPLALGQPGPNDFTRGQQPCGNYFGSEFGCYCEPAAMDDNIGRYTCAYRTGPPCAPAGRGPLYPNGNSEH